MLGLERGKSNLIVNRGVAGFDSQSVQEWSRFSGGGTDLAPTKSESRRSLRRLKCAGVRERGLPGESREAHLLLYSSTRGSHGPMKSTWTASAAFRFVILAAAFLCSIAVPRPSAAETAAAAWLRYSALTPQEAQGYRRLPAGTVLVGDSILLRTAQQELIQGVAQMLGKTLREGPLSSPENAIVLGTLTQLHALAPALHAPQELRADGYWFKSAKIRGSECLIIAGANERGVLYGVFGLLSKIARGEKLDAIDEVQ